MGSSLSRSILGSPPQTQKRIQYNGPLGAHCQWINPKLVNLKWVNLKLLQGIAYIERRLSDGQYLADHRCLVTSGR